MFGAKQKKAKFKFKLGDKVRDTITGYEGILIGRTQWLHNCNTYLIKSTKLKDEKPMASESFDEPQLALIEKKVHQPKRNTGGPVESVEPGNR